MIELMSFSEWEAAQDPKKIFEWGSTAASDSAEMIHNKIAFEDIPRITRFSFYREYVSACTNPSWPAPIGKRIDIEKL